MYLLQNAMRGGVILVVSVAGSMRGGLLLVVFVAGYMRGGLLLVVSVARYCERVPAIGGICCRML